MLAALLGGRGASGDSRGQLIVLCGRSFSGKTTVAGWLRDALHGRVVSRTVLRGTGNRGRLGWTRRSNRWAWTAYLGHRPQVDEPRPYASPARRADLSGLPAAWIGVGDLDLFLDEAVDYAQRLQAAHVTVDLHVEPGVHHAADRDVQPMPPSMRAFQERALSALAQALKAPSAGVVE